MCVCTCVCVRGDETYNNCINTDVNECQTSNGGCNQTCTNIDGLFECSCGAGYTLAANDLDCDGI